MSNNEKIDWGKLESLLSPQQRSEVSMFRTNNSSDNNIWSIEADDNGQEYIVRKGWNTTVDHNKESIMLFYNDMPIHQFNSSKYNFNKQSANQFSEFIVKKAKEDKKFTKKILSFQSNNYKRVLKNSCPELFIAIADVENSLEEKSKDKIEEGIFDDCITLKECYDRAEELYQELKNEKARLEMSRQLIKKTKELRR